MWTSGTGRRARNKLLCEWPNDLQQGWQGCTMRREYCAQQIMLGKLDTHTWKNGFGPFAYTIYKNQLKTDQNWNYKTWNYKILRRKYRLETSGHEIWQWFLVRDTKVTCTKTKNRPMRLHQILKLLCSGATHQSSEIATQAMGKLSASHTFDEELISRLYKEHSPLINKKMKNLMKKTDKWLEYIFLQRRYTKDQRVYEKRIRCYWSSWKCRSKSEWAITSCLLERPLPNKQNKIINVCTDVETLEHYYIVGENVKR